MPATRLSKYIDAGGNSGIGIETARALAHAGAKVILTSRKVSAGEEVVAQIKKDGVKVCIRAFAVLCPRLSLLPTSRLHT